MDQFAGPQTMRGSLVDVFGVGLLAAGRSGFGKSEIALDLVERGHRLAANDVVLVAEMGDPVWMDSCADLIQQVMEVRGLGMPGIRSMFGARAIRVVKRGELAGNMQ